MKKRVLFISLVLALVLTTFVPASVLAQQPAPFFTAGAITNISNGNVLPDGNSGGGQVIGRELGGRFMCGSITGPFTMTYKANIDLTTQAGNFHGVMNTGPYVIKVKGKIETLQYEELGLCSLPKLSINGNWTFGEGAKGQGEFDGWAVFIPTTEDDPEGPGYVKQILYSFFTMTGGWHQ